MAASMVKLNAYIIHGTTRAFCISLVPKEESPNATGIWVPKAAIAKRKVVLAATGEWSKEEWEMTKKCYKQYVHEKACKTYADEV